MKRENVGPKGFLVAIERNRRNVMAAIIEFPKEASIWRQKRTSAQSEPGTTGAKILMFTGVRYAKRQISDTPADPSEASVSKEKKSR